MDDDFGDGDPERNGILRLEGMRESEIVGMNAASHNDCRFEAMSRDHVVDDILGLLSNPISDK